MKIIFIQQLRFEWLAPMIFSAIAKEKGVETKLLIESDSTTAARMAIREKPDAIIFASIITGNYAFVAKCAEVIKQEANILIMAGGIHVTMFYRKLDMNSIDIFGIGEGENSFSGVLDMLNNKKSVGDIPGIAYMQNGLLVVNPPEYVTDLDSLPLPDYELYYKYSCFRKEKVRMFYSGRGCQYDCKYCCVPYSNKGQPRIRKRSPTSMISEILYVDKKYGMKAAFFQDDTFLQDKEWLKEFLALYKQLVKKEFMCLSNAQDLDMITIKELRESGCVSIGIGVESMNCRIRKNINRFDTDEQIMQALFWAKKAGMKITTFNMLGLPGETLQDIINTIDFYRYFKVDSVWCVLYQDFMQDKKEVWDNKVGNFYMSLNTEIKNQKKIETIQKLMPFIVKCPWLIKKTQTGIVRRLSYILFALDSYTREIRIWKRSIWFVFIVGVYNQYCYNKNRKGMD